MLSGNQVANFLQISFRHITCNQLELIAKRKKIVRKEKKISKKKLENLRFRTRSIIINNNKNISSKPIVTHI